MKVSNFCRSTLWSSPCYWHHESAQLLQVHSVVNLHVTEIMKVSNFCRSRVIPLWSVTDIIKGWPFARFMSDACMLVPHLFLVTHWGSATYVVLSQVLSGEKECLFYTVCALAWSPPNVVVKCLYVYVRTYMYTGHVKNCVDVPIGILFERVLYWVNRNITSLDNAKCSAYM